jgi:hypothetical protein
MQDLFVFFKSLRFFSVHHYKNGLMQYQKIRIIITWNQVSYSLLINIQYNLSSREASEGTSDAPIKSGTCKEKKFNMNESRNHNLHDVQQQDMNHVKQARRVLSCSL